MLAASAVERRIAGKRLAALRTRAEVTRATMGAARTLGTHPLGVGGGERRPVPGRTVAVGQRALVCCHTPSRYRESPAGPRSGVAARVFYEPYRPPGNWRRATRG